MARKIIRTIKKGKREVKREVKHLGSRLVGKSKVSSSKRTRSSSLARTRPSLAQRQARSENIQKAQEARRKQWWEI